MNKLDKYFSISERGSSLRTEMLAGVSTFLALSYIFVVNPAILSAMGVGKSAIFFATILGSVVTTLVMGLWARLPFAVAPGLEMNAYVAYVVVGVMGFTWQGALGAVFWSGVLTVLFSFSGIRVKIVNAIPDSLKVGLAAAVGIFLLLIALKVSGIAVYDGIALKGIANLFSKPALIFYVGLFCALVLKRLHVRGSVLGSIIIATVFAHVIGAAPAGEAFSLGKDLFAATFKLDFGVIFNPKIWSVILVLFILDFYGSIAKFIGLTKTTSILQENELPRLKEGLIVDGGGTVLGALTGTSNLITYVESAVGIGEGGRTGIVAVVVAVLMSLFIFLTPLLALIPAAATTGALFFVGLSLFPSRKDVNGLFDKLAISAMVITTIVTFGLDKAMFAGFATYIILNLIARKFNKLNVYFVGSAFVLMLSLVIS
ncbi:MAG TPA: NCS2 family permease [Patescibacteria group bacterium]|nr:NCS2 family permease [Patescibacteria group bacterium]